MKPSTLSNAFPPSFRPQLRFNQWVGDKTTDQGALKDCYFLSALDALFQNEPLTRAVMKDVTPVNETCYWVKRSDGRRVWVDLTRQPGFPDRVRGPLGYQVLEAAYRDLPLSIVAPDPSRFDQGGYSVDVWLALLRNQPGIFPVQYGGNDWETTLGQGGYADGVAAVLYQAANQSPPALVTATTLKKPREQTVKSRYTYGGLNYQQARIYKRFGHEWMPHHVYSVTDLTYDKSGNLLITVDNPYLGVGQQTAKTVLTLPEFLQVFSRLDALQF